MLVDGRIRTNNVGSGRPENIRVQFILIRSEYLVRHSHFKYQVTDYCQVEDELLSLQAELESGLTELGQTEAKRLEALQVRLTVSLIFILFIYYPGSPILRYR